MSQGTDSWSGNRSTLRLSPTFVIVMTIFIDLTGFGMVIPLLPFYADSLQAGSTALGVLVASFAVMQFVFSPVLGRVSDRVGRRPILLLSILTSMASFVLFALAQSFIVLLLSRLIAGMATETAVAQAYIADITSKKGRAAGIGKVGAAHGAGFIVGPAIGGFLSVYGFWAPGVAAALLTLVNFVFVLLFLPESINRSDTIIQQQRSSREGIIRRALHTSIRSEIGAVLTIFFIITLAFSAIPVVAPLLGRDLFGIGPVEMSYFFIYIGLVQVLLQGFVIGRVAMRFGEEKLIAVGVLLIMMGMLFTPLISHIANFLISLTTVVFGIGVLNTVIPSFISKRTTAAKQGGALGTAQSVSSMARVPGPLIGGFVYEFAGLAAPFFLSAAFLAFAFGLSCRVFQICARAARIS